MKQLTIEDCENLFWLAARDYIFFHTYNEEIKDWDDGWHIAVNCNDTFYYACADATSFKVHEAKELREIVEKFGWCGGVAWCAVKRGEEPIKELQTENYHKAVSELK